MHRKTTRAVSLLLVLSMVVALSAVTALRSDADVELPPDEFTDASTSVSEVTEPVEETNEPASVETETPTEATEPTEPEEPIEDRELTDQELIEMYQIPNTWSRKALLFAVRNGLLSGTGDGTLSPTKTATRAEIATILVGALPTEYSADLSAYTDLQSDKWYYKPIGRAVALGLISGTGKTTMTPNGRATREQAAVILASAFGLTDGDRSALYGFKDWLNVSEWAVPAMSAMVKAGHLAGSNGKLNPQKNITREEFAQIVYSMIDRFSPEELTETEGTTVTYLTELPAGTVVEGDLLICNDAAEMVLDQVTVKGRLILQGAVPLQLSVTDCNIRKLAICRPTELSLGGEIGDVIVIDDTTIHGDTACVTMAGGDLTIAADAKVGTVTAGPQAKGSVLTVDGTLEQATITTKMTLKGTGTVKRADVLASSFPHELKPEVLNFTKDPGIGALQVTATPSGMPSVSDPFKTVTLSFDGNLPEGTCDVVWYLNGEFAVVDAGVKLTKSKQLAHQFDFSGDFRNYSNRLIEVAVLYQGQRKTYTFKIPIQLSYLMYNVSDVKTMDIPVTVLYTTSVYSKSNLTNKIGSVSKGTTAIYKAYVDTTAAKILLPDGTLGWVKYSAIKIPTTGFYTGKDYVQEVKEAWVNQKGYSSPTKYLVWCNLYTQRVNVFKGSKGNWKLVCTSQCASGSNYTPTPQEVTKLYYKSNKWYYDDFYVHHISVFDSSRGFHSMLYNYDSYTLYNTAMGCPASHGCVRMPDEGLLYIWDNVPVNSTVVIY